MKTDHQSETLWIITIDSQDKIYQTYKNKNAIQSHFLFDEEWSKFFFMIQWLIHVYFDN